MNFLRRAWSFIIPTDPTGFLVYGWLGCALVGFVSPLFPGVALAVPMLLVWIPLWWRATTVRAQFRRMRKELNESRTNDSAEE